LQIFITNMKRLLTFIIPALLVFSPPSMAQKVERVAPVYGNDDMANKMITYISNNLKMVIPEGRSLKDVSGMMRCKITIDKNGRISDINLRSSITMWLDIVIIEGLKAIPPSPDWKSNAERELKKTLVFAFGGSRKRNKYGLDIANINRKIDESIEKQREKEKDRVTKHYSEWNETTKEQTKIDMPLTPDRNKNPHVELITPEYKRDLDAPKIEISLE